jgi:hypothetical protein
MMNKVADIVCHEEKQKALPQNEPGYHPFAFDVLRIFLVAPAQHELFQ